MFALLYPPNEGRKLVRKGSSTKDILASRDRKNRECVSESDRLGSLPFDMKGRASGHHVQTSRCSCFLLRRGH
jgi:hypothetical protein